MASINFINECRNPAYKNRLGKVQIGDNLLYLTVKENLKVSNGLKISSKPTNEDRYTGYLSEITFSDGCYSNGSIIGTTISRTSTVKVLDVRDLIGTDFIPSLGVKYTDDTTEYINIGKYITQKQTIDKTAQNSTVEGQDILYKLDESYTCGITDWTNITVKDLLLDLCNSLGLELGTTTFINETLIVNGDYYQKNCKYRDVLSDICEVACSWGELGEDGKLYLKWFTDTIVDTLDKSQYTTLERNSNYGEVNCLVIKDSNFEGENVTMQDEESISQNGETQIAIIDNNLLNTEQLRQQAIAGIWNRIKGFKYVDCKIISYYGKPYLRRGDKIKVQDNDGTYFETYVLTHSFKYDGCFYSEIASPSITKEQTAIKNTNLTPKQRLSNAEAKVLKNEAQISLMVEEQEEIQSNLNENYYTKTTVNELIEDTKNGLTNKYMVGGGNNLFKNTGLHFESTKYSSGYESWEGVAKRITNIQSKSRTSIMLQNGSLKQRQEVPNGVYTISFEYEKKNDLANASIKINDVEYNLETKGNFTKTVETQTSEIIIEFICDVNDGYEVYELMVNYGEVALTYSQNANETTTDTVQIGEGIKITSSTTNSTFKADSDGIRIENKANNTTTEFLDNGMKTTNLEADKGIIANLLIEEVDGQVWIVGLGR